MTVDAPAPALEARGIVKRYAMGSSTVGALEGVSISCKAGTFTSVMGPSGSGKSTLLHVLGLLEMADAGTLHVGGVDVGPLDDDARTVMRRDKIGFVFQTFELLPTLSARDNIMLPADIAGRASAAESRLTRLAERMGIADRLHHRPAELSGGQRQRVALARALINDPVVILADEPTGNLDSSSGADVLRLLRSGVDEQGWTVVMVTHDANAALTSDEVTFLRDGRIAGSVPTRAADARARIAQFTGV